jgi:hypothetical protein
MNVDPSNILRAHWQIGTFANCRYSKYLQIPHIRGNAKVKRNACCAYLLSDTCSRRFSRIKTLSFSLAYPDVAEGDKTGLDSVSGHPSDANI